MWGIFQLRWCATKLQALHYLAGLSPGLWWHGIITMILPVTASHEALDSGEIPIQGETKQRHKVTEVTESKALF